MGAGSGRGGGPAGCVPPSGPGGTTLPVASLDLPAPGQGLLLCNNSGKQLLSCLAKVGSFSQWSSDTDTCYDMDEP